MTTYTSRIHFKGLMLFVTRPEPVQVIVPYVDGDAYVAPHQAYAAFKKDTADSEWNIMDLPGVPNYKTFLLTGETIVLNAGGPPLQFQNFLPRLKRYCPNINKLRDDFLRADSPYTAAHVILTGGDVGWYVSGGKRIDTVIDLSGDYPLVVTGIKNGRSRTLKFKGDAELVIGNSDFQPTGKTKDFLFYYRMFEVGGGCTDIPAEADADDNPHAKNAVIPDIGLIDIACSNSQYP